MGVPGRGPGKGRRTPHFLFSVLPKRENGPCTVQKRKGAFGGCGSFPLRLKGAQQTCCVDERTSSSSRASRIARRGRDSLPFYCRQTNTLPRTGPDSAKHGTNGRGLASTRQVSTVPFYRSGRLPRAPKASLFFWTVHGPFSFLRKRRKENGGCAAPSPARGRETPVPRPWARHPLPAPCRRDTPGRTPTNERGGPGAQGSARQAEQPQAGQRV